MKRREFLMTSLGGAGVAASAGAATAQEETTTTTAGGGGNQSGGGGNQTGGNQSGGNQTGGGGGGGGGGATHTVDMTDGLVFDPAELTIAPGDTVVWENVGGVGHSVTAYEEEIPEGATYFASGGFDSESAARNAYPSQGDIPGGESYQHTFQTTGTFGYFCIPHEGAGMVGSIEVAEGGGGGGGGGGEPAEVDPEEMGVPIQAHYVGIAAILMLFVSSVFTFFMLKYGESAHTKGGN